MNKYIKKTKKTRVSLVEADLDLIVLDQPPLPAQELRQLLQLFLVIGAVCLFGLFLCLSSYYYYHHYYCLLFGLYSFVCWISVSSFGRCRACHFHACSCYAACLSSYLLCVYIVMCVVFVCFVLLVRCCLGVIVCYLLVVVPLPCMSRGDLNIVHEHPRLQTWQTVHKQRSRSVRKR